MNVFLDTMIYLHCSPIEQIDFCDLLDTSSVTIVVPRITLRELDKHKSTHSSSKIRDRARRTLSYLEKAFRSSEEIRDGVKIEFVSRMPRIDLSERGLNPAWNDDLMIASVLDYKQSESSAETILVSHDANVRLTCGHLDIKTMELPDRFRLPPELDERDKEIRLLKRDLQKLQNARPRLSVAFAATSETTARFVLQQPDLLDASLIARRLQSIRDAHPKLPKEDESPDMPGAAAVIKHLRQIKSMLPQIPEKEYQRYNREREEYFKRYEEYQHKMLDFRNRVSRAFGFSLHIANVGSAPAEDVDVSIHFPDGFAMFIEDDLPDEPREPMPPVRPRFAAELMTARIRDFSPHLMEPNIRNLGRHVSTFDLKKTNSYDLTDHFQKIKHGSSVELPELFVVFDSHEGARSFNCDYVLLYWFSLTLSFDGLEFAS